MHVRNYARVHVRVEDSERASERAAVRPAASLEATFGPAYFPVASAAPVVSIHLLRVSYPPPRAS